MYVFESEFQEVANTKTLYIVPKPALWFGIWRAFGDGLLVGGVEGGFGNRRVAIARLMGKKSKTTAHVRLLYFSNM